MRLFLVRHGQTHANVARQLDTAVPGLDLTDEGRAGREAIEQLTDELALPPYEHLGQEGADRLRELLTPLSKAVIAAGGLPVKPT